MLQSFLHRKENTAINKGAVVSVYAVSHFIVDFACAFLMFSSLKGTGQWYLCLLLYNFCAFALQMPMGLLADSLNRNSIVAVLGCSLIILGYMAGGLPVASSILAGVGNGLFHVGGGIEVLNISGEKSSALGIFVSPGALGIYLGTMLGKKGEQGAVSAVLLLLVSVVVILILVVFVRRSFISNNSPLSFKNAKSPHSLIILGCLFFVVCLRSYVGMILSFPWKNEGYWGMILTCSVVLGKAAGGILADKIGAIAASVLSLGLSATFFVFLQYPLAGVLAVFLFNMTMPITLWAVARILPGAKGFAFGLLTFGLFMGFAPVYLGLDPLFTDPVGFGVAALISLILLLFGLKKAVTT